MMKRLVRAKVLAMRNTHPERERVKKSERIAERLFELPEFRKARVVLFYASKEKEVHTHDMIGRALVAGKRVVLPITDTKARELRLSEIKTLGELAPGAFGIPEPRTERPVSPDELELVIVPGVAFDERGDRVGYGMGYYDKLLKRVKCPTVALAFEFQMVPHAHGEEHDVAVQKIVTEERVIECRG